jgi:hypothetical protein
VKLAIVVVHQSSSFERVCVNILMRIWFVDIIADPAVYMCKGKGEVVPLLN